MSFRCDTLAGMSEALSKLLAEHPDRIEGPTFGSYVVDGRFEVYETGGRYDAWDRRDDDYDKDDKPLGGFRPGGRDTAVKKLTEVLRWPAEWRELSPADLRLAVTAWYESALRREARP